MTARTSWNVFPDLEPPTKQMCRHGPARTGSALICPTLGPFEPQLSNFWGLVALACLIGAFILGPILGDRQPELLGGTAVTSPFASIFLPVRCAVHILVDRFCVNNGVNISMNRLVNSTVVCVVHKHRFKNRLERRRKSRDLLGLSRRELFQRFNPGLQPLGSPHIRRFSAPYARELRQYPDSWSLHLWVVPANRVDFPVRCLELDG